jgi:hypothetical protein
MEQGKEGGRREGEEGRGLRRWREEKREGRGRRRRVALKKTI